MARTKDDITISRKEWERIQQELRAAQALAEIAEAEREVLDGRLREVKDLDELIKEGQKATD